MEIPAQVAARIAAVQARKDAGLEARTAVVPVWLSWTDHLRAHEACHAAAGLWNTCVDWLHGQWRVGKSPGKEDVRRFATQLPAEQRPLHAHTTQAVAYDLWDAVAAMRENKRQGRKARAPWREKQYRPLSFTRNFGWRITPEGRLSLSLGRGRKQLLLAVPEVVSREGVPVGPQLWGEIRLCWDRNARRWSLHVGYHTPADPLPAPELDADGKPAGPVVIVAVDEGIINPMTLSARLPDGTMRVLVINGRQGRAAKRWRNKQVGRLQRKLSRCTNGSKRHRRLVEAKKRVQAKTDRRLHDFDHQVTAKASRFPRDVHRTWTDHHRQQARATDAAAPRLGVRLVVGDVRGIEQRSAKKRRASRSTRQQLSQWSRGRQERCLAHKTGLRLEHVSEAYSTQTCPKCLRRWKTRGRDYVCRNPECGFAAHRDAVGSVGIHTLAENEGRFLPLTDLRLIWEVTYRRAQPGWSPLQQELHSHHQHVLGRSGPDAKAAGGREARRSARNRATNPTHPGGDGDAVDAPCGASCGTSAAAATLTGAGRAAAPQQLTTRTRNG